MNLNQECAIINFLVLFYHNVNPITAFTLDFIEKHKGWLDEYIFKPFALGGLEAISSEITERTANQYQAERNAYLM